MLSGSYLLHHKQRQSDKPESVSEVFKRDGTTDQPRRIRLVKSQQRINDEREVEYAAQGKQRLLQSAM